MKEIWKNIEGYDGLYQVSNLGRVKSIERDVIYNNGAIHHQEEKILSPVDRGNGYLYVCLYKNRNQKKMSIHRLVAQAFINNPNNLPQVNHKDENKENNCVSNLEYCTSKYNLNYGTHNKRVAEAQSKTVYQYSLDGILIKVWKSTQECNRNEYKQGNVAACCRNEYIRQGNNIYKGFIWSYNKL